MYTLIDQKKLQIQRELRMIIKTEDTFNKKTNTTGVLCSLCLWIEFVELQLVHEHKIYISYTEQSIKHDTTLFKLSREQLHNYGDNVEENKGKSQELTGIYKPYYLPFKRIPLWSCHFCQCPSSSSKEPVLIQNCQCICKEQKTF